eukprot:TRINITY_DN15046_c0_g1_i1.p1 TRINITY_DN15046_c0_g1~~TRINITY_DN15046_c0_g1_i1.p1  ORF type:complete len:539 (-),score=69.22 TRINITY_DN15046_c0_g1_i1:241-1857(-)
MAATKKLFGKLEKIATTEETQEEGPLDMDQGMLDGSYEEVVWKIREGATAVEKKEGAAAVRSLTRFSLEAREALAARGAVSALLEMIAGNSGDMESQEVAVLGLCNLAIGHSRNKRLMVSLGALSTLVPLLHSPHLSVREASSAVLLTLASEPSLKALICRSGAVPFLSVLLLHGTLQGRRDAAHVLYNLMGCDESRGEIVRANPMGGLIGVMKDGIETSAAERACVVIYGLVSGEAGRLSFAQEPSAVSCLLEAIQRGTERCREMAASSLLATCTHSRRVRHQLVDEGLVPTILELRQEASPRVRSKIRALLKCLEKPGSAPVVLMSATRASLHIVTTDQSGKPLGPSSEGQVAGREGREGECKESWRRQVNTAGVLQHCSVSGQPEDVSVCIPSSSLSAGYPAPLSHPPTGPIRHDGLIREDQSSLCNRVPVANFEERTEGGSDQDVILNHSGRFGVDSRNAVESYDVAITSLSRSLREDGAVTNALHKVGRGELQGSGNSVPEFTSGNSIMREMVRESMIGAMKSIRQRANLPKT